MIDGLDSGAVIKIIAGVISAVVLAVLGRSLVIRRVSHDRVVVAADGGQVDIIAVLQDERTTLVGRLDKLTTQRDDALREHSTAMLEVGGLRKEVEHLTLRLGDQSRQLLEQALKMEMLQNTVGALRAQIESLMGLRDVGRNPEGGDL